MKEFKIEQRSVFGLIIVLIGGVMLLDSFGVYDIDISIGTWWPLILIAFGLVRIINYDESTFFGVIVLLIGVYFQLSNLGVDIVHNVSFHSIFWPAIIILFGLSLIFPVGRRKKSAQDGRYKDDDEKNQ